jgi:hypothetical protein
MVPSRLIAPLTVLAACALAPLAAAALALGATAIAFRPSATAIASHPSTHSPLRSRELWATVDVCNPHDQPNTIGVRGSMPGDGQAKDTLYMRFRVQYLEPSGKQWAYVKQGADSGWLKLGSAKAARQAGRSFQFAHVTGRPAFSLRGAVGFQWRHGAAVRYETMRVTSAGHKSVAGADPKGYSAATCTLP